MDTRTFLSRVSAPLDNIVVSLWKAEAGQPRGIFWNRGCFADLDDAVAAIQMWDKDPDWTVYYAIGRMANNSYTKDNGKTGYYRKKEHATHFKIICFDLDIGGKYSTQAEGHKAVMAAVRDIKLPPPMVVTSGRGIHYYWPLIEPVVTAAWEEVSIALRLALADKQVEIDTSKIHDASMVLRPVGTHWKKETPWREVKVLSDCPDYEFADIKAALTPWVGRRAPAAGPKKPASSVALAVLKNANLNLLSLGKKCRQVEAVLKSGGEFDAMGVTVTEPLWRGFLGLATYTPEPEASMMMLCGKHPDFDHDENMAKMAAWTSPPTTCAYFEQHCTGGCIGCMYKGVASPASLNEETITLPTTPVAQQVAAVAPTTERLMPPEYYVSSGRVYTDVEKEEKIKDADGKTIVRQVKQKTLVCDYELHVNAMFSDLRHIDGSTASISVRYPGGEWKEHDMPIEAVYGNGKDFTHFLADKTMILADHLVQRTRDYLMRYMQYVQQRTPLGGDFKHFGWQDDGSFLCGVDLIGSPSKNKLRRLKGAAEQFSRIICRHGSRDTWADITSICDKPGGETMGVGILVGAAGVMGGASGLGFPLVSFYSTETASGKSVALMFGSSLYMNPDQHHMFRPADTENALFGAFGMLNHLSPAIDELTTALPEKAYNLAYVSSQGREKIRMTRDAETREPAHWDSPVRASTNTSLYDVYDLHAARNAPVRARTLQFQMDNKDFINANGELLAQTLLDNYGHAMPELAQKVTDGGGRKALWGKYREKFEKEFNFVFENEERFFKNLCIACYAAGELGKDAGLFRFDHVRILNYMLATIVHVRKQTLAAKADAFDTLGQFMQEYNHQMVVSRRHVTAREPQVQYPVPDLACMRMDLIFDDKLPVLPGSVLAVNSAALKKWLVRQRDSYDSFVSDLMSMGGVVRERDRVTIYRGCQTQNPGQAWCLMVDLNHPRMAVSLNGGKPIPVASPGPAILQPQAVNGIP